jgi:hypothetical protein
MKFVQSLTVPNRREILGSTRRWQRADQVHVPPSIIQRELNNIILRPLIAIRCMRVKKPDLGARFGCAKLLGRGKGPEDYITQLKGPRSLRRALLAEHRAERLRETKRDR